MQPSVDTCPGMLTLHPARDGDVARIRLPGGYLTGPQWAALAELACEFGDGNADITARGNVQVRGLRSGAGVGLARRAAAAGLLPSRQHDRARNITASPLAGLGRRQPLRHLVQALDDAIVADPELATLPGRFVFALDDGTGGSGLSRADVGLRQSGPESELFIAGAAVRRLPPSEAVPAMVSAAHAAIALGVGTICARIRELPGGGGAVAAAIGSPARAAAPADSGRLPLGPLHLGPDEVVVCGARLGRLTAGQVALTGSLLAESGMLRLAAAGRVVIPLAGEPAAAVARLAAADLITSDGDAMSGVSACSGIACSRSLADVRALARPLPGRPRTHWAGCARGCGAPSDADLIVAAGPGRFLSGGQPVAIAPGVS